MAKRKQKHKKFKRPKGTEYRIVEPKAKKVYTKMPVIEVKTLMESKEVQAIFVPIKFNGEFNTKFNKQLKKKYPRAFQRLSIVMDNFHNFKGKNIIIKDWDKEGNAIKLIFAQILRDDGSLSPVNFSKGLTQYSMHHRDFVATSIAIPYEALPFKSMPFKTFMDLIELELEKTPVRTYIIKGEFRC